jgi:uncharacterized protein (DUF58 family)
VSEGPRTAVYRTFLLGAMLLVSLLSLATRSTALAALVLTWGALLVSAFRSARGRQRGLDAARELYPSAFEDDAVAVDVLLENRSGRAAHLVEIADSFGAGMAERQALLEPGPLPPWRRRRLRYRTFCSKRWGIYPVGPLRIATCDPMGLFHVERRTASVELFTVFPRVSEMAGIERLGARASLARQEATAGRAGQSAHYLGVRDYRPGDDVRRIHWPATARRGTAVVKEYELDLTPYFTLFLDLSRAHRAGTGLKSTLEYVVRTAASLVWSAARRGDLTQVFAEGAEPLFVPPGRGEVHLAFALQELVKARQEGGADPLDLVARHAAHLPEGSTAALLSATTELDLARLGEVLESLRGRGVRAVVLCVEADTFLAIDRRSPPRERVAARGEELLLFLRSRGVAGAVLTAEQDLASELARADLFEEAG